MSILKPLIYERDRGVCQLCVGKHPSGTAHHAIPHNPKDGGPDCETNLVWIGQTSGGFGGCHMAAHNDLPSSKTILLRRLAAMYLVEVHEGDRGLFWPRIRFQGEPWDKPRIVLTEFPTEEYALRAGLARLQQEIDAGRRPSLLSVPA